MPKLKHKGNITLEHIAELVAKSADVKNIIEINSNTIIAATGNCKGIEIQLKPKYIRINTSFTKSSCRRWFYFSVFALGLIIPLLIYTFAWYIPTFVKLKKVYKHLQMEI